METWPRNNILYEVLLGFYVFLSNVCLPWNKISNYPTNYFIFPRYNRQNVIFECIMKANPYLLFWFPCCLCLNLMFLGPICRTSHFSILNPHFQISSQYVNLFWSICVISFDNGKLSSLTSSTNSCISDFISLGKIFMNIKNNKSPSCSMKIRCTYKSNKQISIDQANGISQSTSIDIITMTSLIEALNTPDELGHIEIWIRCLAALARVKKLKDEKASRGENEIIDLFLATEDCQAVDKISTTDNQRGLEELTYEEIIMIIKNNIQKKKKDSLLQRK